MKTILPEVTRGMNEKCQMVAAKLEYMSGVSLSDIQDMWIDKAIIHHRGNLSETAQAIGVSRSTLHRHLKKRNP